jgi:hypothetical protein
MNVNLTVVLTFYLVVLGIGWFFLKKKRVAFLKLLYMDTNGAIVMLILYFFNGLTPVSDIFLW